MNRTDIGGPAFPHEYKYGDGTAQRFYGMSLRDYFAAKAMQGLISNGGSSHKEVAQAAYIVAGAMLKEREPK
jgi:hypothetical protein